MGGARNLVYAVHFTRGKENGVDFDADMCLRDYGRVVDELGEADLALATLCDMVLGEDAEDRSNDALIRAVGMMLRRENAS